MLWCIMHAQRALLDGAECTGKLRPGVTARTIGMCFGWCISKQSASGPAYDDMLEYRDADCCHVFSVAVVA